MSGMRMLRAVLLVLALAAAVVVFVVGSRDGGTDWQVPALVLIGVLVLIIHAATATGRHPAPQVVPTQTVVASTLTYEERHHHANPHHIAVPSAAELGGQATSAVVSAATAHVGMTDIVVPASSFPDAGHGHGPVIRVADDSPPPPLHSVLQSTQPPTPPTAPVPAAAPTSPWLPPPDPAAILTPPAHGRSTASAAALHAEAPAQIAPSGEPGPTSVQGPPGLAIPSGAAQPTDPVLVDLRPETDDPMVMRVLPGEPPPASRADVTSPDVSAMAPPVASPDTDHDLWMPTSWIPESSNGTDPGVTGSGNGGPPPFGG